MRPRSRVGPCDPGDRPVPAARLAGGVPVTNAREPTFRPARPKAPDLRNSRRGVPLTYRAVYAGPDRRSATAPEPRARAGRAGPRSRARAEARAPLLLTAQYVSAAPVDLECATGWARAS